MPKRTLNGGLFPEDRRRKYPLPSEPARDTTPESALRSRILNLLLQSNFQAAVTDSGTVHTVKGQRQLVYPSGWPDITASVPVSARAWGIEVKTAVGKFREAQEEKLAELEAAGWLVTRAVGEQGVVDVNAEIKRQLAAIDPRAFEKYLLALRRLSSEAGARAAEREFLNSLPRNNR